MHYEFAREECISNAFTDSAAPSYFGQLKRSSATECKAGLGVSLRDYSTMGSAQVQSVNDATSFISHMISASKTSMSIEFWKRSGLKNSPTATTLPIVTIGAVGDTVKNDCTITGSHNTFSVTISESEADIDYLTNRRNGGRVRRAPCPRSRLI